MKEVNNIIIQNLNAHQKELVSKAMETTGKGAASKAIFQILSEHQRLRRDVFNLEKELALERASKPRRMKEKPVPTGDVSLSPANQETHNHIKQNPDTTSDLLAELAGKEERTIRDRIKILKESGLIAVRNDGNQRRYSVIDE